MSLSNNFSNIESAYFALVCAEPRGGSQDDFEPVLKGYYDSICQGNKPAFGRKRRVKKIDVNHLNEVESPENSKKGAAFLAVCRGKVHTYISLLTVFLERDFKLTNSIYLARPTKFNLIALSDVN